MKTNGRIQLYPILRLVIFMVAGIVIGDAIYGKLSVNIWFAAFLACIFMAFFLEKHCIAQTVAIFLSFVFLGGTLTTYRLSQVNVDLPDDEIEFSAVIVSPPSVKGKVVQCDMLVTDIPRPVKIKANIYRDEYAEQLRAGYGIRAVSKIEEPCNYFKSDFDYRRYLLNHGFVGTTFIYKDEWYGDSVSLRNLSTIERVRIRALLYRNKLLDQLRSLGLEGQGYAVLAAMTLGERVSMSEDMTDDYSVSGALHVLSLSGLHLGIIYVMLTLLFLGRKKVVMVQVLIILAIWTYVFIVGFPLSAVRSAIMLSIYSLVSLLNRDHVSLNVWSLAALSLLIYNPLNFYDVGFQMSFISVLFIILLFQPIYNVLPKMLRDVCIVKWTWQMTSVSLAAQLGVAPLVALYFGRFSCYFLLTNFFVVPISTVILYVTFFVFVTGWLPWLQSALCVVLIKAVECMNYCVSFVASLPGASIDNINLNVVQTLLIYMIIACCCIAVRYIKKMFW